jgi:hypothetical protein
MGRFDALTQLDKKPLSPTPPPDVSAVADPQAPDPLPENEIVRLLAKKQTSKLANQHVSVPVNQQTSKEAKKQTSLPVNQQTSKLLKKFGSYLTEDSLKGLKRIAFETDRKDYEVLQEAVDQYLERNKTG